MRAFSATLALALIPMSSLAQNLDAGFTAYHSGNYAAALHEFQIPAEQGNATAQFILGGMYLDGLGVPQNHVEAARWYRAAAEQGDIRAQFNLGVMHAKAEGVPQDYVTAHMWLNIAAAKGHSNAAESREALARMMTPTDLSEAQRRAQVCLETGYQSCI